MTIDLRADAWRDTAIQFLATRGLARFTGLGDRSHLLALAHRLVTIRPSATPTPTASASASSRHAEPVRPAESPHGYSAGPAPSFGWSWLAGRAIRPGPP